MAKWIGNAWSAEEAEDNSDSDNKNLATLCIWVLQPKSMTLTTLFGGKVWWVERLTEISEEEVLMEVLAEQMDKAWQGYGYILKMSLLTT